MTLGEQKNIKTRGFADLASDELTGGFDIIKGERVKIHGYLEDFTLSKIEADELIMFEKYNLQRLRDEKWKTKKLTISGNPKKPIKKLDFPKTKGKKQL